MTHECSATACNIDLDFLIITIDNGKELLAFCPNDMAMWMVSLIQSEPFDVESYPSQLDTNVSLTCEVCKETDEFESSEANEVFVYRTENRGGNLEMHLCRQHIYRLTQHSLNPEAFFVLKENHGIFHEIHDDFYDETDGYAIQPMEL